MYVIMRLVLLTYVHTYICIIQFLNWFIYYFKPRAHTPFIKLFMQVNMLAILLYNLYN